MRIRTDNYIALKSVFIRSLLLILLLTGINPELIAQTGQGNIWVFGNHAGLNFNGSTPVNYTGGAINNLEGSATISDSNGNLIFYTDGMSIWNKNHQLMESGLMGHNSATQSGVIVPHPTSADTYYVFTIDATQNNLNNGLRYTIVDMTLNNGLGDVPSASKNVLLTPSGVKMAEKITAVRHCNNRDIWVIAHGYTRSPSSAGQKFYAYLITPAGVTTTPVISTVGTVHKDGADNHYGNSRGYMKASPDGRKIAVAISYDGCNPSFSWAGPSWCSNSSGAVEICDFDYTSGIVSSPLKFTGTLKGVYGIEFSPNGNVLYATGWGAYGGYKRVWQWNLAAGSSTAIKNSQTTIVTENNYLLGAMQLASNGKIYIARDNRNYLSAINYPNKIGSSCGYQSVSISVGSNRSRLGLPTFVQSYFDPNRGFTFSHAYEDEITQFLIADSVRIDSVFWKFNDPNSTQSDTSTLFNPHFKFSDTGTFNVLLVIYRCNIIDSVIHEVIIYPRPNTAYVINDTAQCLTDNLVQFTDSTTIESGIIATWHWEFGDGDTSNLQSPSHHYTGIGVFTVKLVTKSDHGGKDSLNKSVRIMTSPNASLFVNDTLQCFGGNIFYLANTSTISSSSTLSYLWDFGNGTTSTSSFVPPVTYSLDDTFTIKLRVTSDSGCVDSAMQDVFVRPMPVAGFTVNDTNQCLFNNHFVFIDTSSITYDALSYLWDFDDNDTSTASSTTHQYSVVDSYYVKQVVTSAYGCKDSAIQKLQVWPMPTARFSIDDSTQCFNENSFHMIDSSTVAVGILRFLWFMGNGDTLAGSNPAYSYSTADTFTVTQLAVSINGCQDTAWHKAIIFPSPVAAFSINDSDQCVNVDTFQFTNLSTLAWGNLSYLWNFGDNDTTSQISPQHSYAANDTLNVQIVSSSALGCPDTTSKKVIIFPLPIPDFTVNDSTQCLAGNLFKFRDTSSVAYGSVSSFYWDFGDGDTSTAQYPDHSYSTADTQEVMLVSTSSFGCKDTTDDHVIIYPMPYDLHESPDWSELSNQLLVWYPFAGNANDASGNSLNATASGVTQVSGIKGSAYSFDGVNDFVEHAHNAAFIPGSRSWTIAAWVKTSSSGTEKVIVEWNRCGANASCGSSDGAAYSLKILSSNKVQFYVGDDNTGTGAGFSLVSSATINDGKWHFVSGVLDTDNDSMYLYLDNCIASKQKAVTTTISAGTVSVPLEIGRSYNTSSPDKYFSGSIDEFRLYGRALNKYEVNALYTESKPLNVQVASTQACYTDSVQILVINPEYDVKYSLYNAMTLNQIGSSKTSTCEDTLFFNTGSIFDTTYFKILAVNNTTLCSRFLDTLIKIYNFPQPTAFFTINDSDQCLTGNNFVFINLSTVSSGVLSYYWDFGDTLYSNLTGPSHSYAGYNTYTVKLISTTNNGCKDSTTRQLIVRPMPVAAFTINDTSQCLYANQFAFYNNSTIAYGSISPYWHFGDNDTSYSQNPTHSYAADDSFDVWLKVTSNYGCPDSASHKMLVFPMPTSAFTINDSDQCLRNNLFQFQNNTTINSGQLNPYWYFGDNDTSTQTSPAHTYLAYDSFTVKLLSISGQGCRDSAYKNITVYPMPVAGFYINDSNQCLNTNSFEFVNTSTVPYGSLGYLWEFGDGASSTSSATTHVYTTDDTFYVNLVATSNYSCIDTLTQKAYVFPNPVPAYSVNDSQQCFNENNFQFANATGIHSGSSTYLWTFGDNSQSTLSNPNHSYLTDDTFSVKMIATSGLGCSDSLSSTVYVFPSPVPLFSLNDSTQCFSANQFILANQTTIHSGNLRYTWEFGDGQNDTLNNPVHTYNSYDTFTITLYATSALNCPDTTSSTVYVYPMPQSAFGVNDSTQCLSGNSFSFTNTTTLAYGTLSYQWDFGDQAGSATQQSPVYSYSDHDTLVVELMASSEKGCLDSAYQTVYIFPMPNADFSINDSSQCVRDNHFAITNKTSIPWGNLSYYWNFGEGYATTDTHPTYNYSSFDTFRINLEVQSEKGCRDSLWKDVYVRPMPSAAYNVNDTSQCLYGNLFSFTNQSSIPYGNFHAEWYFGDGDTSSSDNSSHSFYYFDTFYSKLVQVTDFNCKDTAYQTLYVHPMPLADFMINDSTQCLRGNTFDFTNSSFIYSGTLSYDWQISDGYSSTATDVNHVFINHDTFTVKMLTVSGQGCSDSMTKKAYVYPMPQAAYALYDSSQCFENNAFGFANNSAIDNGSMTFLWSFGDGDSSTLINPVHSYAYPDTFNVKLVATSDKNCLDSASGITYVHVHPQPVAGFFVDDSAQCLRGNLFEFTDSTTIPSGYTLAYWSLGDGATDTGTVVSHSYQNSDTLSVMLMSISDWGCKDSIFRKVIKYPMPQAEFTIADSLQCLVVNNFLLTNATTIKWGTMSYQWMFGDGDSAFTGNTNHSYPRDDTFGVQMVAESAMGCFDTILHYTYVHPMPVAGFVIDSARQCLVGNNFNFSDQSNVKWGSLTNYWAFNDGDTSTLISPAHSYSYFDTFYVFMRTTSNMGCSDSTTQLLVVEPNPSAFYTVNDSQQCLHENVVEFTNQSTVPYGLMTYKWLMGNGDTLFYKNHNYTYGQDDTFPVSLITYSSFMCPDTITKTIYIHPSAESGFTINNSRQCYNGNNFVFTNTSALHWGSMSYDWDFGDGDTSSLLNPTHIYTNDDTFLVRLITNTGLGCADTAYRTTNVYPSPVADFGINTAAQCLRDNYFIFTNNSTIHSGYMTYFWNMDDSFSSGNTDTSHSFLYADTFRVKLIATSDNNCKDSLVQNAVVHPMPYAAYTVNDSTQCERYNRFYFNDVSSIAYGSTTSGWLLGDGASSASASPVHTYANHDTFDIRLIATSLDGCRDTVRGKTYVYPMPASAFSVNDSSQCLRGNLFEFTNKSLIDWGKLAYTWYYSDGDSSKQSDPAHSYPTATKHSVYLVSKSGMGCYDTAYKDIYLRPMPKAAFTVNDSTQCLTDNNFIFTNNSTVASGNLTYSWYFGDGDSAFTLSANHNYSTDGSFPVMLRAISDVYNCADTATIEMVVHPMPQADFVYTTPCLFDTVHFTDQSTINTPDFNNNWYWDFNDGFVAVVQHPDHVFSTPGTYTVSLLVTSNRGCADTALAKLIFYERATAPFLDRVTVENNEFVKVEWLASTQGRPKIYILEKSNDNINFNLINNFNPSVLAYNDKGVDVSVNSYTYRLKTVDSCAYESPWSNIGKSILLKVDTSGEYPWLSWSDYEDWPVGVADYDIFVQDNWARKQVLISTETIPEYLDDRTKLNQTDYCYLVQANRNGDAQTSASNVVCVETPLYLQVPTAFTPNEDFKNDTFKIKGTHILEFTMRIFDRWGELMYETNDVTQGWDGTFQNEKAPMGVYYVYIDARGTMYQFKRFKGTVTLLR